jgi:hypothetical protein
MEDDVGVVWVGKQSGHGCDERKMNPWTVRREETRNPLPPQVCLQVPDSHALGSPSNGPTRHARMQVKATSVGHQGEKSGPEASRAEGALPS